MTTTGAVKKPRDIRLDFFRGLSLTAIYAAHVPGDWLAEIIWARFGLSDAAHVFVFISGYAAAIAFGGTFVRDGFAAGFKRIARRCVQLYGVHLSLFACGAALCAVAAMLGVDYAAFLGIGAFFADPATTLELLLRLAYVPTYFDILPLYIVVLAAVPLAMALARIDPRWVIALSASLWLAVQIFEMNFESNAPEGRGWGFNPMAWQLLFFTGFAASRGWLPKLRRSNLLLAASIVWLVLGVGAVSPIVYERNATLGLLHDWFYAHANKPNLDIRQYAHFLALAIVTLRIVDAWPGLLAHAFAQPFATMGRQALTVFFTGMVLAHAGGIAFALMGTGLFPQIAVNAVGLGGIYAAARIAAWLKSRNRASAASSAAAAA
jgi:hypothetical protein